MPCECKNVYACNKHNPAMNTVRESVKGAPAILREIVDTLLDIHEEYNGICLNCYQGQDCHENFPCASITRTVGIINRVRESGSVLPLHHFTDPTAHRDSNPDHSLSDPDGT